jgi:uncharacterized protein involved in response to NO
VESTRPLFAGGPYDTLMRFNLFAYGFRSQFLLAGFGAMVLIPLWTLSFVWGADIGTGWPPTLWHAHEMLFGFITCAIAGFMLTAVPSWTGQKGFAGPPLMALAITWVAARILIGTSRFWPPLLPSIVDLAFLPMLALLVMIPLIRSRNRNTPLLAVLAALWVANLIFHVGLLHHDSPLAHKAIIAGIDVTLLLITVIGGRIVPAFTTSALRQRGIETTLNSSAGLSAASIAVMICVIAGDIIWPDSRLAGWIAAVAAVIQVLKFAQWRPLLTAHQPIVWILHLAYMWLPIGFALKAAALLGGYAFAAFWLHALTIGALTTMITAVMTRASLGHTGRPLRVHPLITLAYLLLTVATLIRVFGLLLPGSSYPTVIALAALFWTASFVLFVGFYSPILLGPRVDGKPG